MVPSDTSPTANRLRRTSARRQSRSGVVGEQDNRWLLPNECSGVKPVFRNFRRSFPFRPNGKPTASPFLANPRPGSSSGSRTAEELACPTCRQRHDSAPDRRGARAPRRAPDRVLRASAPRTTRPRPSSARSPTCWRARGERALAPHRRLVRRAATTPGAVPSSASSCSTTSNRATRTSAGIRDQAHRWRTSTPRASCRRWPTDIELATCSYRPSRSGTTRPRRRS